MDAGQYVQTLVGKRLSYGIKSPDTDLYEFGFSNLPEDEPCRRILHAVCPFEIRDSSGAAYFDIDTPCELFHSSIQRLIGREVRRAALSDKNDLWLDLGICHMVFLTWENGEESWRLFRRGGTHWVASDKIIEPQ